MAYKLKIYFAGTAFNANEVQRKRSDSEESICNISIEDTDKKIIRVYFSGCQNREIGGRSLYLGLFYPDLHVVTRRLLRCFSKEKKLFFNIEQLKETFSSSVIVEMPSSMGRASGQLITSIEVNHIDLIGFSRGAVTTFLVAKQLDRFDVDINIYAEEPTPGESKEGFGKAMKGSSYICDAYHLENCQNIKMAKIVLGDHSQLDETNIYYRQMSPIFNENTNTNIYLFSKNTHSFVGVFGHMQLSSYLLPPTVQVSSSYHQQLRALGLTTLCKFLHLQPASIIEQLDDCPDVKAEEQPSFEDNDIFFGDTVRDRFIEEPSYLPRSLKKSYHFGVMGRVQCAPSIKHYYQLKFEAFYLTPASLRLRQVQALCYLCLHSSEKPTVSYPALIQRICDMSGDISENIALRDLIIELGRSCTYFSKRSELMSELMQQLLRVVIDEFELVASSSLMNTWGQVKGCINTFLKDHKKQIPKECYEQLVASLKETLKTSPLFHLMLVKYIKQLDDETMDCNPKIALNRAFDFTPTNSFELIRNIFFSTLSRRQILFKEYKGKLESLGFTLENIIDLTHLLNKAQGSELLNLSCVKKMTMRLRQGNTLSHFISQLPNSLQAEVAPELASTYRTMIF